MSPPWPSASTPSAPAASNPPGRRLRPRSPRRQPHRRRRLAHKRRLRRALSKLHKPGYRQHLPPRPFPNPTEPGRPRPDFAPASRKILDVPTTPPSDKRDTPSARPRHRRTGFSTSSAMAPLRGSRASARPSPRPRRDGSADAWIHHHPPVRTTNALTGGCPVELSHIYFLALRLYCFIR
jgi:hypothetical protein